MISLNPAAIESIERHPPVSDWQRHALFLDFDGTLAPIVARPDDVRLAPETRELLDRLIAATGGAVAVLTGRSLESLSMHLEGLTLAMSGSHGLECVLPGEQMPPIEETEGQVALYTAFAELKPLADAEDLLLERKPGAVALHVRNRPDLAAACRDAVTRIAQKHGLRALHGNLVSEATMLDVDKGRALRQFMQAPRFAGRVPIMIGDDTTDEDAFRAAKDLGGYGVRIGGGETAAQYRADRMEQALDWLAKSLVEASDEP